MSRDPTCVFHCDAELVLRLEERLGPPIDSYLMGWQVWIEPVRLAGDEVDLEFRLHPPGGFGQPAGLSHHDLWDAVVTQLVEGRGELELGTERRQLEDVWVLLEAYPAHGDDPEPEVLCAAVEERLGLSALASGYVDHERLGARWKRTKGRFDLPRELLDQLA